MFTDYNSFSPSSDVVFTKASANKAGGKSVGVVHNSNRKSLHLNTPLMLTWGMNEYEQANGGNSYDFSLQFPREEYVSRETTEFLRVMKEFEDNIKTAAEKNAKEWFGKSTMSPEVIDALWTPMLKYPKNQETGEPDLERDPQLRIKVPCWDGIWRCELYDTEQNTLFPSDDGKTPVDMITKLSNIACVIQCGGIWFANGKFGVTWRLVQAVVKPQETFKGKCHLFLTESEKERMVGKSEVNTSDDVTENVEESNEEVVSDGEQEDDVVEEDEPEDEPDEEEAEPEPVVVEEPPKKKKVVRKKKA
tara:strand:+ start:276 stop:1190 length:915 start_codon:yes stop_codon:yes gene_type:complete